MQLYEKIERLKELKTAVLLVSFEEKDFWINAWLHETVTRFPLLVDPDRSVYKSYGLQSSRWRAWGLRTVIYYIKALFRGEHIFKTGGDTAQVGGDFIIDGEGRIAMVERSSGPTGRPSTDQIIATLEMISVKK